MTRARRCRRPRFRVHNLVRFEAGSLRGAGLALFQPACGAHARSFRGEVLKKSDNQSFPAPGAPGACIRARSPRMRIWLYATAPARTLRNDLLSAFLSSFDRKSGATAARGVGTSGRGASRGAGAGPGRVGARPERVPGGREGAGPSPLPQVSTVIRVLFGNRRVDRDRATP